MQSKSQYISAYITNTEAMSQSTARAYEYRLNIFDSFVSSKYHINTDNLIKKIKEWHGDPYKVLSSYAAYLQGNRYISSLTLKQELVTAKNWLEYYDIDISPRMLTFNINHFGSCILFCSISLTIWSMAILTVQMPVLNG